MKLLLIFVLLGVSFAQIKEERGTSLDEVFKHPKSGRIMYERMQMAPPPTVAYSCKTLFEALRLHSISNMLQHLDWKSLIIYNTALPGQGVYKGKKGAIELLGKMYQTAMLSESSYEIRHVDEARGICIVDTNCKGTFRRSNNTLETHSTSVIKFKLGKIRLMNIVDHDFNSTISAFQTKAENKLDQILRSFFGGSSMDNYLAQDLEVQLPNLHPALQHGEKKPLRGKEAFGIFSSLAKDLILNRTITVKYLWGNDTSVVSMWVLKPSADFHIWNLKSKKMAAMVLTTMYVCTDFNEQGLMRSFKALFNRPFLPWEAYRVGLELEKVGELKKEAATGLPAPKEEARKEVATGLPMPKEVATGLPVPKEVATGLPVPKEVATGLPARKEAATGLPAPKEKEGVTGLPARKEGATGLPAP
jgi:hypothetical protein